MTVIVETDDFRGDHAKDIEVAVEIDDNEPVSRLRNLAKQYAIHGGMDATLRILPEGVAE